MYNFYLRETDMIENSQFPAIALFNEASNQNIVAFFENLSNGTGGGYNYVSCYFWNELDEYDQAEMNPFQGLCVETDDNEQIILSYQQVLMYMRLTAQRYFQIDNDSTKHTKLIEFIEKFNNRFLTA